MDRFISQITSFMSSIQSLFSRVESSGRRTSRFVTWIQSMNWRDNEDEDETEEIEKKKSLKSNR